LSEWQKVEVSGRRVASSALRTRRARARVTTHHARRFLTTVAKSIQENGNGAKHGGGAANTHKAEAVAAGVSKTVQEAAGSAAGKAAKKAPAKVWWKSLESAAKDVSAHVGSTLKKKAAELRGPAMEMKVNVDVLKPTIDSVKKGASDFWAVVPPPVRKASPYIGVALATAVVVHSVESKFRKASEKKLFSKMALLAEEKQGIAERMKELEGSRYMRGDSTVDLSRAVSEATAAAASAAAAAAEAARYCVVPRR